MHKTLIVITATLALAGCASTSERSSVALVSAPQPIVRQAPLVSAPQRASDPATASLRPGPTYVASFPEADRRAACERLEYREGTNAYARCLIGDFPENPFFSQAR